MKNALDQYISLYDGARARIEGASSDPLNRLRGKARRTLERAALPDRRTEGFEKTSIEDMFAPDYGVNIDRVYIPVDAAASFRCDVPNLSTLTGFVVNDSFVPSSLLSSKLPAGVMFMSLAAATRDYPELVGRYYGKLAPEEDASVALNTMLVQDGVFIHVAAGVHVDKPLQLINIFSAPISLAAFRRVLVVVEDDARVQLMMCDHTQDRANAYLGSQIVEVFVGRDASFEMCSIEESSAVTSRYSRLFMSQDKGSHTVINSTTLTCGNTRNDFIIDLMDEHAECHLSGMAIGGGAMHIDNDSDVRHNAGHCKSDQLFKYVMDDKSTGAFEGSILVADGARFTEAFQTNRNILASTEARMHCKPQLEIYNDDVKCSHGATTGQLDNDALFYMRSRGIPEHEARTMLMQAFMIDVIDTVRIPGLQDRLRHLVERRFAGKLGNCAGCGC